MQGCPICCRTLSIARESSLVSTHFNHVHASVNQRDLCKEHLNKLRMLQTLTGIIRYLRDPSIDLQYHAWGPHVLYPLYNTGGMMMTFLFLEGGIPFAPSNIYVYVCVCVCVCVCV